MYMWCVCSCVVVKHGYSVQDECVCLCVVYVCVRVCIYVCARVCAHVHTHT